MKQITIEYDLEVGRYYFLREKGKPEQLPEIEKCKQPEGCPKCFKNRIWAAEGNPQAFDKWDIFGPVEIPVELVL